LLVVVQVVVSWAAVVALVVIEKLKQVIMELTQQVL
jgi:hypothetical protein